MLGLDIRDGAGPGPAFPATREHPPHGRAQRDGSHVSAL